MHSPFDSISEEPGMQPGNVPALTCTKKRPAQGNSADQPVLKPDESTSKEAAPAASQPVAQGAPHPPLDDASTPAKRACLSSGTRASVSTASSSSLLSLPSAPNSEQAQDSSAASGQHGKAEDAVPGDCPSVHLAHVFQPSLLPHGPQPTGSNLGTPALSHQIDVASDTACADKEDQGHAHLPYMQLKHAVNIQSLMAGSSSVEQRQQQDRTAGPGKEREQAPGSGSDGWATTTIAMTKNQSSSPNACPHPSPVLDTPLKVSSRQQVRRMPVSPPGMPLPVSPTCTAKAVMHANPRTRYHVNTATSSGLKVQTGQQCFPAAKVLARAQAHVHAHAQSTATNAASKQCIRRSGRGQQRQISAGAGPSSSAAVRAEEDTGKHAREIAGAPSEEQSDEQARAQGTAGGVLDSRGGGGSDASGRDSTNATFLEAPRLNLESLPPGTGLKRYGASCHSTPAANKMLQRVLAEHMRNSASYKIYCMTGGDVGMLDLLDSVYPGMTQALKHGAFCSCIEARQVTNPCDPCYINPALKGDMQRMPQRGVFVRAGHQLPPNTLLGVYHGQFKTLAEDAAYTGEDVTGARGVAASYTFSAPWSYESEGEGLALVGHSNGSLMGLLNDVMQWGTCADPKLCSRPNSPCTCHMYKDRQPNAKAVWCFRKVVRDRKQGKGRPEYCAFLIIMTTRGIGPDAEVLMDWGQQYWDVVMNNLNQFLFVDKLQQENTQLHHQIKQLQQQVSGRYGHSAQAQALAAPTASAQLAAVQVAPAARGPNVAEAYVDAKDPAEEQQQQQQEMLMVEGSMHGHVGVHVLPAPAAYVAGGMGPGSTVHEAAGAAGAAAGCHLQRASSNVASTAATTHGSTAALQLLPANGIHTARAELHRLLQACVDMLPRAKAEDAHAEQQAQAQLAAAESAQSILHKQLHAAQVECTALQAQHVAAMEGWRSENASLSSQLANAQAATSSAERQRDTALTDAAAQAQTAADLQQMNESVQAAQLAAVEAFAKRESALQVQLGTLAEQLQAMQQEAAIGKGKQKELEGDLRQAQKASIEVQTQLRDWQDECKRAEEGWKLRCDRAEANESLAKHLVTELEGQLAEGRAAAQAAAAEVEAATRNHARVNNITAQWDHAQRDAAGARKLVQQLQRQLQQEREQRTTDHDMAGAGQQERNSGTTEPEVIDLRDED